MIIKIRMKIIYICASFLKKSFHSAIIKPKKRRYEIWRKSLKDKEL